MAYDGIEKFGNSSLKKVAQNVTGLPSLVIGCRDDVANGKELDTWLSDERASKVGAESFDEIENILSAIQTQSCFTHHPWNQLPCP